MTSISLEERKARLAGLFPFVSTIRTAIAEVIVGQEYMVDRLLIGLLADGHVLLEGAPGLAKTLTVRSLAAAIDLPFSRVQFTPDLLPADLVGTEIYSPKDGSFSTRKGPIFGSILLADEINRAPPKVQSALLEAMAEKQVTIGGETHALPNPFLVLATQNPLEQEGTYPLPEAQADRFMFKVVVGYPKQANEKEVLMRSWNPSAQRVPRVSSHEELMACRSGLEHILVKEIIVDYVLALVRNTRGEEGGTLSRYIAFGASPRASLSLLHASRAHAFMQGRTFVTPDDVKALVADVLRHRIILTYEAEAEGVNHDWLIRQLLQQTRTP
jgi:MoxR-like ATPase